MINFDFRRNTKTFVEDIVESAVGLPVYPLKTHNGSFRTKPGEYIKEMWRGFSGYDDPGITYTIVMGRWSRLIASERRRLVAGNRHNSSLYLTYTFEQLMRRGIERPFTQW